MYEAWVQVGEPVIMKYRPIIFKGWGVRGIQDDTKTMTRRLRGLEKINECPDKWNVVDYNPMTTEVVFERRPGEVLTLRCPYGQPGDKLWVRETWYRWCATEACDDPRDSIWYRADGEKHVHWKSSIHMYRWASRLTREITEVLPPQRVQEISELDARAEGCRTASEGYGLDRTALGNFALEWDKINAKRGHGWDVNDWVWPFRFKRVT